MCGSRIILLPRNSSLGVATRLYRTFGCFVEARNVCVGGACHQSEICFRIWFVYMGGVTKGIFEMCLAVGCGAGSDYAAFDLYGRCGLHVGRYIGIGSSPCVVLNRGPKGKYVYRVCEELRNLVRFYMQFSILNYRYFKL